MGCDIHLFVEKKDNNNWIGVYGQNPWISEYESFAKTAAKRGDIQKAKWDQEYVDKLKRDCPTVLEGWLYDGRNYNLFAILADVRNEYDIKPIDMPRGLPVDVSNEVQGENHDWDLGGHSYSYFTFKELLDYDWENHSVENEGFVDEYTYKNFKETGNPYPCSKDVDGGNVKKVLNSEMNRILKNKYSWEENKSFYTAIKWSEKFSEIAKVFLDNLNDYIFKNNIIDLDDYRIVFWFDN